MKMLNLFRAKKIRVATARRHAGAAEIDYAELPEPNMKLSRALLIVLLLHVVAVSGIIAFNVIKTRQGSFVPADLVNNGASPTAKVQSTPDSATSSPQSAPPLTQRGSPDRAKPSDSPAKFAGAEGHKSDHAKPVQRPKVPVLLG